LFAHGLKPPPVRYERSIDAALNKLHRVLEPGADGRINSSAHT
jgi:hypothetical protein